MMGLSFPWLLQRQGRVVLPQVRCHPGELDPRGYQRIFLHQITPGEAVNSSSPTRDFSHGTGTTSRTPSHEL